MIKEFQKRSENLERKPKILVFDIETAPNLAYVWGKYEQDAIDFENEWYVLCWCAKWLGQKKVMNSKLNDFQKRFRKDKQDDYEIVKKLWKLMDEADIVIAHNGDRFDIRKINTRFIYHGFTPPAPYKSIDTLKIAKKHFSFNSNKLDDLGHFLKVGRKVKHEGFDLWLKCMNGNKTAWNKMLKYNKQDVVLLEKVYKVLLPWIHNHPNLGLYQEKVKVCPNCGSENIIKKGYRYTKTLQYQRYLCKNCGSWCQNKKATSDNKPSIKK